MPGGVAFRDGVEDMYLLLNGLVNPGGYVIRANYVEVSVVVMPGGGSV